MEKREEVKLPAAIAKDYEPADKFKVRFITKGPIKREINMNKIHISSVPFLVDLGYLIPKKSAPVDTDKK